MIWKTKKIRTKVMLGLQRVMFELLSWRQVIGENSSCSAPYNLTLLLVMSVENIRRCY